MDDNRDGVVLVSEDYDEFDEPAAAPENDPVFDVMHFIMAHKSAESAQYAGWAAQWHEDLVKMTKERDMWRNRAIAWENADEALQYARALSRGEWDLGL